MGRRSRKRSDAGAKRAAAERAAARTSAPVAEPPDAAPRRTPPTTRRARLDEAPKPPWAPFPLTEVCILIGLISLVIALVSSRGPLVIFGLAVVTLATLELSLREHFAGYRSHSALLAAIAAMVVAAPLAALAQPAKIVVLIVAAVVFLLVLQVMRELFRRRTGGMSWRA
jgi:hypothetical protein